MAQVIDKQQCPKCLDTGMDNLAVYEDESSYCFSCETYTKGDNMEPKQQSITSKKVSSMIETGIFMDIDARGISKKTCEFFNYQIGKFTGYLANEHVIDERVHIANYCDEYGNIVAQKLRASRKRMCIRGDSSKMLLYGQWKYQPNEKLFITVVEGEIDALSVAQAQGTQFAIVSVPIGAAGAKKYLKNNLEFLQGFKHVVLAFDNDEAGHKATQECVGLFEPGKVRIANWPTKDANDLLVAGRLKEIKDTLFNARGIRPDKISSPLELLPKVLEKPVIGARWKWDKLTDMTYGMRENQLITVGASTGVGKTTIVNDIILDMIDKQDVPCGIFSFEQSAEDTTRRLIGGMLKVPLHLPGAVWNEKDIINCAHKLEGKAFIYSNWGGATIEDISPKIRYLTKACGVKLIVIDHLMAIAAKIRGTDERRGIDIVMETLASLTRELRCCIILVSHLARDKRAGANKDNSWGSGRAPSLENLRGSSSIEAWSDVVIGVSRNADAEDEAERNILTVDCLKSRLAGNMRGTKFMLKYNVKTNSLDDLPL